MFLMDGIYCGFYRYPPHVGGNCQLCPQSSNIATDTIKLSLKGEFTKHEQHAILVEMCGVPRGDDATTFIGKQVYR